MIEESVDLDEIYRIATEELGMQEATDAQIVYYTYNYSNYLRQYSAVPDKEQTSISEYFSE